MVENQTTSIDLHAFNHSLLPFAIGFVICMAVNSVNLSSHHSIHDNILYATYQKCHNDSNGLISQSDDTELFPIWYKYSSKQYSMSIDK